MCIHSKVFFLLYNIVLIVVFNGLFFHNFLGLEVDYLKRNGKKIYTAIIQIFEIFILFIAESNALSLKAGTSCSKRFLKKNYFGPSLDFFLKNQFVKKIDFDLF